MAEPYRLAVDIHVLYFLLNVATVQLLHVGKTHKLIPTHELADVCLWLSFRLTSDVNQFCRCIEFRMTIHMRQGSTGIQPISNIKGAQDMQDMLILQNKQPAMSTVT